MSSLHTRAVISAFALATMFASGCSHESVHESVHGKSLHHAAQTSNQAAQPTTYGIQDDSRSWKQSPQLHAYYDMTAATFSHGTNIDVDAYEARSFALFREFARANHANEEAMLDHLKLIPRQVVGIVKENPAVLKSYDSFWVAMVGPD